MSNPENDISFGYLRELGDNMRLIQASVGKLSEDLHSNAITMEQIKAEPGVHKDLVATLTKLVRDGNGRPSLMTQVAILHEEMKVCKEWRADHDKNESEVQGWQYNARWQVIAALLGALISGAIGLAALLK